MDAEEGSPEVASEDGVRRAIMFSRKGTGEADGTRVDAWTGQELFIAKTPTRLV